MKTLTKLLIPAMLMLVAPVQQAVYAADVSVRVLPHKFAADEVCGLSWAGRCEEGIWCDDWYIPIAVPYGEAVTTTMCGGHFGEVFAWRANGYGEAQAFEPIGPGGPIQVNSWVQWGSGGPEAIEFRIHTVGVFEFLESWFAGNADFNGDGITSVQDIFDFLAAM